MLLLYDIVSDIKKNYKCGTEPNVMPPGVVRPTGNTIRERSG